MKISFKSNGFLIFLSCLLFGISIYLYRNKVTSNAGKPAVKLYWFIPDGFRADKGDFNIFEWANQGELPNLKKMMENGCYGYSWPVFPGHTPTNFATLMTGVTPDIHGIADGSMRIPGYPLDMVAKGGFSSFAKLVPPLWVQLEDIGSLVTLQSIPGSTPPQIYRGNTIRGRWGAWGIDFPAIIFQDKNDKDFLVEIGQNKRLFTLGSDLTRFGSAKKPHGWNLENDTHKIEAGNFEIDLTNWDYELFAVAQNKKSTGEPFERLIFSHDKKSIIADLAVGEWSEWLPVKLNYKLKNDYQKNSPKKSKFEDELASVEIETFMKIKVIRLGKNGEYRIRILYDNLNEYMTSPPTLAAEMQTRIGPMTDYVDNYPPQLIFYPQDKTTFLEEADMSWQWHQHAVPYLVRDLKSDVVMQSIYTPNQMLTSRWWLPFIDKQSYRFGEKNENERNLLWKEVKGMYREADKLLGEIMANTDSDWYVILSSDHGVLPLYREVRLNNLFHQKGWLNYKFNSESNEFEIDWENTKVIYLQMNNIYINPKNLSGIYNRSKTPEYFKLRAEVKQLVESLEDPETKKKVASHIWNYEDALQAHMPADRVGDLIISNEAQYNWSEDVSSDNKIFVGTKKGGYKQGVWPESAEAMLTPFVIMGPNIKQGCKIEQPIRHVDQFATISKILGNEAPYKLSGKVIEEIFKK